MVQPMTIPSRASVYPPLLLEQLITGDWGQYKQVFPPNDLPNYNALMARRIKRDASEPAIKPERQPRVRVLRMDEPPGAELPVDDSGLSLEDLGQAYASLLQRGGIPYEEQA